MVIGMPLAPRLHFRGIPDTADPATQPSFRVALDEIYAMHLAVTLTLSFAPDAGADDPSVQFATGGRTLRLTMPAGSVEIPALSVQTGTVAGLITITAGMQSAGQDVTPEPAPTETIRVNPTPPVLASVTAIRTSSGFTVAAVGYAPTRDLSEASFQFTGTPGSNLRTTALTLPVDALFAAWYSDPDSAQFGSQFQFTQIFTVTGDTLSIASVSVTLTGKAGTSGAVSASVQ